MRGRKVQSRDCALPDVVWPAAAKRQPPHRGGKWAATSGTVVTSLVRGFWDEIFWPSKPRTTEEPRTSGEGHRKVGIWTKF